jgi:hypothetical protein
MYRERGLESDNRTTEEKIDTVIESLPEGLKDFWRAQKEKAEESDSLDEFFEKKIKNLPQRIREAKEGAYGDRDFEVEFSEFATEREKRESDLLQTVKKILQEQSAEIGSGKTASVCERIVGSDETVYCFKVIKNINAEDYSRFNDVESEFNLLCRANRNSGLSPAPAVLRNKE